MTDEPNTSGVQDLIERLSKEGVAEGQRQGENIVGDAQKKADAIIEQAKRQADEIRQQARQDAQQFQAAGEDALKVACRDAVRDLGSRIHEGFRNRLQELVQQQLAEPKLVKRMILEVTRDATKSLDDSNVELLLSRDIIKEDEVRQRIDAGNTDVLTDFVKQLIGEDLREGFTVELGAHTSGGMTVRVVNQNVEIDLTQSAITEVIAAHLLPRFRAIMRKT